VGDYLAERERFEEAIAQYKQATDLDGRSADAYVHLGDAYLASGQDKQALKAYRQARKVAPRNGGSYLGLSDYLLYKGRFKAARLAMPLTVSRIAPITTTAWHGCTSAWAS